VCGLRASLTLHAGQVGSGHRAVASRGGCASISSALQSSIPSNRVSAVYQNGERVMAVHVHVVWLLQWSMAVMEAPAG
jgi:hypothetical protein